MLKHSDEYRALPRKVSNQIIQQVDHDWKAFFAAIRAYKECPDKFLGRPSLPGYKDKIDGRNLLIYEKQAISLIALKKGVIKPSGLDITVSTKQKQVKQVRIVSRKGYYVVEVVYTVTPKSAEGLEGDWVAGIDIGLNNLAAITSNKSGFVPLVVNGRPLKAINQFYNKRKSKAQSKLPNGRHSSHYVTELTNKRNRQINHYLHVASRRIVDYLVSERIGTLVIGKNPNWKQNINLGKQTNQNFVSIPTAKFVDMVSYKARLEGIKVLYQEESYTSKCSFLDLEKIGKKESYAGKRIRRGLFRSGKGILINADVNGSYNIIRKAFPNAFGNGTGGAGTHPTRLIMEYPHKGYKKETPNAFSNGVGVAAVLPANHRLANYQIA